MSYGRPPHGYGRPRQSWGNQDMRFEGGDDRRHGDGFDDPYWREREVDAWGDDRFAGDMQRYDDYNDDFDRGMQYGNQQMRMGHTGRGRGGMHQQRGGSGNRGTSGERGPAPNQRGKPIVNTNKSKPDTTAKKPVEVKKTADEKKSAETKKVTEEAKKTTESKKTTETKKPGETKKIADSITPSKDKKNDEPKKPDEKKTPEKIKNIVDNKNCNETKTPDKTKKVDETKGDPKAKEIKVDNSSEPGKKTGGGLTPKPAGKDFEAKSDKPSNDLKNVKDANTGNSVKKVEQLVKGKPDVKKDTASCSFCDVKFANDQSYWLHIRSLSHIKTETEKKKQAKQAELKASGQVSTSKPTLKSVVTKPPVKSTVQKVVPSSVVQKVTTPRQPVTPFDSKETTLLKQPVKKDQKSTTSSPKTTKEKDGKNVSADKTSTFSVGKVLSTLESEKKEDNQEEIDTDHEEGEIATDEDDDPTYCRYCDIQFDREGAYYMHSRGINHMKKEKAYREAQQARKNALKVQKTVEEATKKSVASKTPQNKNVMPKVTSAAEKKPTITTDKTVKKTVPDKPAVTVQKTTSSKDEKPIQCEFCKIGLPTRQAFFMHTRSDSHMQKELKAQKAAEAAAEKTKKKSESSTLPGLSASGEIKMSSAPTGVRMTTPNTAQQGPKPLMGQMDGPKIPGLGGLETPQLQTPLRPDLISAVGAPRPRYPGPRPFGPNNPGGQVRHPGPPNLRGPISSSGSRSSTAPAAPGIPSGPAASVAVAPGGPGAPVASRGPPGASVGPRGPNIPGAPVGPRGLMVPGAPVGPRGLTGSHGPAGPRGPAGSIGPRGQVGPRGPASGARPIGPGDPFSGPGGQRMPGPRANVPGEQSNESVTEENLMGNQAMYGPRGGSAMGNQMLQRPMGPQRMQGPRMSFPGGPRILGPRGQNAENMDPRKPVPWGDQPRMGIQETPRMPGHDLNQSHDDFQDEPDASNTPSSLLSRLQRLSQSQGPARGFGEKGAFTSESESTSSSNLLGKRKAEVQSLHEGGDAKRPPHMDPSFLNNRQSGMHATKEPIPSLLADMGRDTISNDHPLPSHMKTSQPWGPPQLPFEQKGIEDRPLPAHMRNAPRPDEKSDKFNPDDPSNLPGGFNRMEPQMNEPRQNFPPRRRPDFHQEFPSEAEDPQSWDRDGEGATRNFPPKPFPLREYPPGEFPPRDFHPSDFPQRDYPPKDFPPRDFSPRDFPPRNFPQRPQDMSDPDRLPHDLPSEESDQQFPPRQGARNLPSDRPDAPYPKRPKLNVGGGQPDDLFCECCVLSFPNVQAFDIHCGTESHRQNDFANRKRPLGAPGMPPGRPKPSRFAPPDHPHADGPYCAVCNIPLPSFALLEEHNQTQSHQEALRKKVQNTLFRNPGIIDSTNRTASEEKENRASPVVSTSMPSTRAQREGERPEHYINDILQYCEMPVIGLSYLGIMGPAGDKFCCSLCKAILRIDRILQHFTGVRHRLKYLKTHYTRLYVNIGRAGSKQSAKSKMAEEMAIEVEEREGRDAVDLYANSGDVDDTYVENFQEGTDEASSGSLIPKPSSLSGIPSLLGMDMEPPSSLKKTVFDYGHESGGHSETKQDEDNKFDNMKQQSLQVRPSHYGQSETDNQSLGFNRFSDPERGRDAIGLGIGRGGPMQGGGMDGNQGVGIGFPGSQTLNPDATSTIPRREGEKRPWGPPPSTDAPSKSRWDKESSKTSENDKFWEHKKNTAQKTWNPPSVCGVKSSENPFDGQSYDDQSEPNTTDQFDSPQNQQMNIPGMGRGLQSGTMRGRGNQGMGRGQSQWPGTDDSQGRWGGPGIGRGMDNFGRESTEGQQMGGRGSSQEMGRWGQYPGDDSGVTEKGMRKWGGDEDAMGGPPSQGKGWDVPGKGMMGGFDQELVGQGYNEGVERRAQDQAMGGDNQGMGAQNQGMGRGSRNQSMGRGDPDQQMGQGAKNQGMGQWDQNQGTGQWVQNQGMGQVGQNQGMGRGAQKQGIGRGAQNQGMGRGAQNQGMLRGAQNQGVGEGDENREMGFEAQYQGMEEDTLNQGRGQGGENQGMGRCSQNQGMGRGAQNLGMGRGGAQHQGMGRGAQSQGMGRGAQNQGMGRWDQNQGMDREYNLGFENQSQGLKDPKRDMGGMAQGQGNEGYEGQAMAGFDQDQGLRNQRMSGGTANQGMRQDGQNPQMFRGNRNLQMGDAAQNPEMGANRHEMSTGFQNQDIGRGDRMQGMWGAPQQQNMGVDDQYQESGQGPEDQDMGSYNQPPRLGAQNQGMGRGSQHQGMARSGQNQGAGLQFSGMNAGQRSQMPGMGRGTTNLGMGRGEHNQGNRPFNQESESMQGGQQMKNNFFQCQANTDEPSTTFNYEDTIGEEGSDQYDPSYSNPTNKKDDFRGMRGGPNPAGQNQMTMQTGGTKAQDDFWPRKTDQPGNDSWNQDNKQWPQNANSADEYWGRQSQQPGPTNPQQQQFKTTGANTMSQHGNPNMQQPKPVSTGEGVAKQPVSGRWGVPPKQPEASDPAVSAATGVPPPSSQAGYGVPPPGFPPYNMPPPSMMNPNMPPAGVAPPSSSASGYGTIPTPQSVPSQTSQPNPTSTSQAAPQPVSSGVAPTQPPYGQMPPMAAQAGYGVLPPNFQQPPPAISQQSTPQSTAQSTPQPVSQPGVQNNNLQAQAAAWASTPKPETKPAAQQPPVNTSYSTTNTSMAPATAGPDPYAAYAAYQQQYGQAQSATPQTTPQSTPQPTPQPTPVAAPSTDTTTAPATSTYQTSQEQDYQKYWEQYAQQYQQYQQYQQQYAAYQSAQLAAQGYPVPPSTDTTYQPPVQASVAQTATTPVAASVPPPVQQMQSQAAYPHSAYQPANVTVAATKPTTTSSKGKKTKNSEPSYPPPPLPHEPPPHRPPLPKSPPPKKLLLPTKPKLVKHKAFQ